MAELVLGIDTSTIVCVGLARGGQLLATATVADRMAHVEQLDARWSGGAWPGRGHRRRSRPAGRRPWSGAVHRAPGGIAHRPGARPCRASAAARGLQPRRAGRHSTPSRPAGGVRGGDRRPPSGGLLGAVRGRRRPPGPARGSPRRISAPAADRRTGGPALPRRPGRRARVREPSTPACWPLHGPDLPTPAASRCTCGGRTRRSRPGRSRCSRRTRARPDRRSASLHGAPRRPRPSSWRWSAPDSPRPSSGVSGVGRASCWGEAAGAASPGPPSRSGWSPRT